MALIQTIDSSELYHMACRMDRGHNFGHNGWRAIGDYLEGMSEDTGKDVEVDIVAICCEYSSADDVEDFYEQLGLEMGFNDREEWDCLGTGEKLEAVQDYLQENTSLLICEENLIIWQAF